MTDIPVEHEGPVVFNRPRWRRRPFVVMLKGIIESADRRRHRWTPPRPRQ